MSTKSRKKTMRRARKEMDKLDCFTIHLINSIPAPWRCVECFNSDCQCANCNCVFCEGK